MNENGDQELDLTQLMARIREDAEKRKSNSLVDASAILYKLLKSEERLATSVFSSATSLSPGSFPALTLEPKFEAREPYRLEDLLVFSDETFLRNAYRAILKREPDDSGFAKYLENLRDGRLRKVDILTSLRFSPEGRLRNVKVNGLNRSLLSRKISNVPVLGYLIELLVGIIRLPVLITDHRRLEAQLTLRDERLAEQINARDANFFSRLDETSTNLERAANLSEQLVQAVADLSESHKKVADLHYQQLKAIIREQHEINEDRNRLKADILAELSSMQHQFKGQATAQESQAAELHEFRAKMENSLQRARMELVLQERRLSLLLEEARKRLPHPFAPDQMQVLATERDHLLDSLYCSLEDQFRGTREDIKAKVTSYLPILADAGITTDIVDIGCGRGEWLEVLKEACLSARGIDTSPVMIEECARQGLEAAKAEAVTYLRAQADNSLSAITAFHFVEHLPLETLVSFLDEVARTLKPGGLVILETPNPENILVGACNFYLDPTHRNPIPSQTMQFLLESRGFCRVEVLKSYPMSAAILKGDDEGAKFINHYFFGPLDYGIVAGKV
jgi:2-polyprenyl-3-methyl-5-hydroxy-6-metoxy-1,4-benzoquinol methylase